MVSVVICSFLLQSSSASRLTPRVRGNMSVIQSRISKLAARSILLCPSAPELSNNIIQKGLAFIGDWSGTVVKSGPHERPGILPRRLVGRGGASVVRRNAAITRMEDSDAKVFKEAFA
jgi:hypothetical protein